MFDRWRMDTHVDFFGTSGSKKLDDEAGRRCPNDGIIDEDNPLAIDYFGKRIELQSYTKLTQLLIGLDKRSPNISILDQPL